MSFRLLPKLVVLIALTTVMLDTNEAYANDHKQRLIELLKFKKPEGPGPYPVVVLVSGCRGFDIPFYDRAQAKLVEIGFATARVDYMGARNTRSCNQKPTNTRMAREILVVIEKLSGMDPVKASRINILGWYTGGAGALRMLSMLEERPDIHVASVSGYYTKCINVEPWSVDMPVLALMGGVDKRAPAVFCRKLAQKSAAVNMQIEEYAGAYHWFEDSDLPAKKQFSFGTAGYQQEAAEKAWVELANFLVR